MKIILAFIAIALFNTALFAQIDTISNSQNVNIEVYDVVAVYRDHIDGRGRTRKFTSEIKGDIIKYDESTGVLTFKGVDGKMYSFTSDQYDYFQYDKEFTLKKKKHRVLNPREDSGFEFSAGLSVGFLNIPTGIQFDDTLVGGTTAGFELPVCIKVGASKYLNKNSQIGLTAEYSLFGFETSYFNVGARYQYIYNPTKNAAFYFPVELKFSHYQADYYFVQYTDPISTNSVYPSNTTYDAEVTLNALELNFGQGLSFSLKNKRSLSLELMLLRQFILSEKFIITKDVTPETDFRVYGLKLSVFMNF